MEQWCDLKDIEAVDPEHRTLSDIVRDALGEFLPREKVRLKAAHAAQGEQLHVLTRVHRTLAQRQTGKEIVQRLREVSEGVKLEGWTADGVRFLQGLIVEQRDEIARMPEADYFRAVTLRDIDALTAQLFPRARTLHLIKDRYIDEDEADRLRR
jgi:hypothetical protein